MASIQQRGKIPNRWIVGISIISIVFLMIGFISCEKSQVDKTGQQQSTNQILNIVSGSENEGLKPIIDRFAQQEGIGINIKFMGSVDIMQQLENPQTEFDAAWPANSIWISMGDEQLKRVKKIESIMRSPIVLCVKKSVADRLGWIGKKVTVQDILSETQSGHLRLMSTSATQSNSGAMSYLSYLYAFSGNPQVLEQKHLQDKMVVSNIKKLLKSFNRSSASSGWLKKLMVEKYEYYDAMVNYEALLIEANKELINSGKEPLYAIYPANGLAIADSPIGYIDKGDSQKESIFTKLQQYLLSEPVQKEIQSLGRRTGIVGLDASADKSIFNLDWGIDATRIISPIRMPQTDVIREALFLYQTAFRKPSFTIYALDFSGSMGSNDGEKQLKEAMRILLDQSEAKKYMLQTTPDDITVVIPFSGEIIWETTVKGNQPQELHDLLNRITNQDAGGGTDIYSPVMHAFKIFKTNINNLNNFFPAIILMTDGRSNDNRMDELRDYKQNLDLNWDIPIFGITFGDADLSQLESLAQFSSGNVYDGSKDLIGAFKKAKGNN